MTLSELRFKTFTPAGVACTAITLHDYEHIRPLLCICVCACFCQYSQLEKMRGQECSSIGKLWSCSWHSALMVILERQRNTQIQKYLDKDIRGIKNARIPSFSRSMKHMVWMHGIHHCLAHIMHFLHYTWSAGFEPDGVGSHSVAWLMCEIPQYDRTV